MDCFNGRTLAFFLSAISFTFLTAVTKEVLTAVPSNVKGADISIKKALSSNHSASDSVELWDLMPMDASAGDTLQLCEAGATCGFQEYRRHKGDYTYFPFTYYCAGCPEHQACEVKDQSMTRCFFRYTCQNTTQTGDIHATESANATSSELGVSASSMMPANAASEQNTGVEVVQSPDPFPPSLNCEG